MSLSAILITAAFVLLILGALVWFKRRGGETRYGSINVPVLGQVRWDKSNADGFEPLVVASRLKVIRFLLWKKLNKVYDSNKICRHGNIVLDPDYNKVAEILDIDRKRTVVLNPLLNFERGYASELHNIIRYELFGYANVYKPVSDDDAKNYEEANNVVRQL